MEIVACLSTNTDHHQHPVLFQPHLGSLLPVSSLNNNNNHSHNHSHKGNTMVHDPEKRITVWNKVEKRKLSGNAAPKLKNLEVYLAKNPNCEVYVNQDKDKPASTRMSHVTSASYPYHTSPNSKTNSYLDHNHNHNNSKDTLSHQHQSQQQQQHHHHHQHGILSLGGGGGGGGMAVPSSATTSTWFDAADTCLTPYLAFEQLLSETSNSDFGVTGVASPQWNHTITHLSCSPISSLGSPPLGFSSNKTSELDLLRLPPPSSSATTQPHKRARFSDDVFDFLDQ